MTYITRKTLSTTNSKSGKNIFLNGKINIFLEKLKPKFVTWSSLYDFKWSLSGCNKKKFKSIWRNEVELIR